jgi:hypothetical protein
LLHGITHKFAEGFGVPGNLHISSGRYPCDLYNSPFNTSPPFPAV